MAGNLLDLVAGWAANHAVGSGAVDLSFVPLGPLQMRRHPARQFKLRQVNRHEHEERGENFVASSETSVETRRAARNLLNVLSCSHTLGPVLQPLCDALEALEHGETLEMLRPVSGSQKREFREKRYQEQALGFVAYHAIKRGSKQRAQELVGAEFVVAPNTIRTWDYRLKRDPLIGAFRIACTVQHAENSARLVLDMELYGEINKQLISEQEDKYGLAALRKAAAEYRAITRQ